TFPEGTVSTYPAGDAGAMTAAILALIDDPARRAMAVERTTALVRDRSWERDAIGYLDLVRRLTDGSDRTRRTR
ncbi:MAG: hypothetical protein ABIZ72_01955, partial [Candidatus Limnocylindrales bacterium]